MGPVWTGAKNLALLLPPGIRYPVEIDVGEDIIKECNIMRLGRYPCIIVTRYFLIDVSILSGPLSGRKHFAAGPTG